MASYCGGGLIDFENGEAGGPSEYPWVTSRSVTVLQELLNKEHDYELAQGIWWGNLDECEPGCLYLRKPNSKKQPKETLLYMLDPGEYRRGRECELVPWDTEEAWQTAQKIVGDMAALRYWGTTLTLSDLPDEDLSLVLQLAGFSHLIRLQRLCKRWRFLLRTSSSSTHAFIEDWNDLPAGILRKHRTPTPVGLIGLLDAVQRLIINGYGHVLENKACTCTFGFPRFLELTDYQRIFPALKTVTLANLTLTWRHVAKDWFLDPAPTIGIPVTFVNCIAPAFPTGLPLYEDNLQGHKYVSGSEKSYPAEWLALGEWQVRLPSNFTISNWNEYAAVFERVVWPFPAAQLDWLVVNAPCLNWNETLLNWVHAPNNSWRAQFESHDVLCCSHGPFCGHRGADFYLNQVDGSFRLMLSLILLRECGTSVLPPPFPFDYLRYHVCSFLKHQFDHMDS